MVHVKLEACITPPSRAEVDGSLSTSPGAVVPRPPRSGFAGGRAAAARTSGIPVWEAFLDRGYRRDGTLVPRGLPGAMISMCPTSAGSGRSAGDGELRPGGWALGDAPPKPGASTPTRRMTLARCGGDPVPGR